MSLAFHERLRWWVQAAIPTAAIPTTAIPTKTLLKLPRRDHEQPRLEIMHITVNTVRIGLVGIAGCASLWWRRRRWLETAVKLEEIEKSWICDHTQCFSNKFSHVAKQNFEFINYAKIHIFRMYLSTFPISVFRPLLLWATSQIPIRPLRKVSIICCTVRVLQSAFGRRGGQL